LSSFYITVSNELYEVYSIGDNSLRSSPSSHRRIAEENCKESSRDSLYCRWGGSHERVHLWRNWRW